MERSVAVKKIEKLLGKKWGYRINDKAPTQDERDAAKAALPLAQKQRDAAIAAQLARQQAILAADAEYQSLTTVAREARKHVGKISLLMYGYRITVGTTMDNMFFVVKAEGDNWADVVRKLEAKS